MRRFLLCSDLDRTLIPNGFVPESPGALRLFAHLVVQPEVTLAYVSGRHMALIKEAINEYSLPQPDFVIADVGSTIYSHEVDDWHVWQAWSREIGPDWYGRDSSQLHQTLLDIQELNLQSPDKQGPYKLSYEMPLNTNISSVISRVKACLKEIGIRANIIHSVDEQAGLILLDVLPASANKRHAIEFLMNKQGFGYDNTIFAGDSGNDLDVMLSPIQAVLVANADEDVRSAARYSPVHSLYLARGGFLGMNGNYSAGILEGIAHYMPDVAEWLEVEA